MNPRNMKLTGNLQMNYSNLSINGPSGIVGYKQQ